MTLLNVVIQAICTGARLTSVLTEATSNLLIRVKQRRKYSNEVRLATITAKYMYAK